MSALAFPIAISTQQDTSPNIMKKVAPLCDTIKNTACTLKAIAICYQIAHKVTCEAWQLGT